jgi:hypothetical protein
MLIHCPKQRYRRLLIWIGSAVTSLTAVLALLWIQTGTAAPPPAVPAETTWTAVFTETFESGITAGWFITDTDGITNGEYYWAATAVTASQGLTSVWATGGGVSGTLLQPGNDPYPPNAASLTSYGPIMLSDTAGLSLTFDVWLETEPVSDALQLLVSADNVQYDTEATFSGDSQGWQSQAVNLDSYAGQPQLWFALQFTSNLTIEQRGVFVDNIQLYALPVSRTRTLYLPSIQRIEPTAVPIPDWLAYVNSFRSQTGLQLLAENSEWSNGDWLHGRYMVKNDYVGHDEDPGNPWYSPEGQAAAQNGNTVVSTWVNVPDETLIDFWMTAPFHAVAILDPQLHTTGYGSYREADGGWQAGATLDVGRGRGDLPPNTTFPIPFPADGGETALRQYSGGEWPDPLSPCPGYDAPTGPPILLQIGSGSMTPNVTDFSFKSGETLLASCLYDETSYTNSDPDEQNSGRIILSGRDAIVLIPRNPLTAGQSYTVSITANGETTTWSFTAVTLAQPRPSFPGAVMQAR